MTGRKEYEPSKNGSCGKASINRNIVQFNPDERGYIQSIKVGSQEFVPRESREEPRKGGKMDFFRFVGLGAGELCIFGEQGILMSVRFPYGCDIDYSKKPDLKETFQHTPDYEVLNAGELEKGDVFIADYIDEPQTEDFFVAVGLSCRGFQLIGQNLVYDGDIEYISSDVFKSDERVKRFKREWVTKSTNPFRRWMQR